MGKIKIGVFKEDSKFVQVDMTDHELAKYLRDQSGDNDWTWKKLQNSNTFFSSKGKCLGIVFYTGARQLNKKIYVLRDCIDKSFLTVNNSVENDD